MPSFTDNNGTTFYNQNICRTFQLSATTALQAFTNQICSEVIIINKTGQNVMVYDLGYSSDSNALLLSDSESIILRGITNSMQVSAKTTTGAGVVYYRTQYYSSLPAR